MKILIIILSTVFTLMLIFFFSSVSKMVSNIISKIFLFPVPMFNNFFTIILNKIFKNKNLESILELQNNIKIRFGGIGKIPVILDIYDDIQLKNTDNDCFFYNNSSDVSWLLNNKIGIIFVKKENISQIIPIIYNLFNGRAIHTVTFHLKHKQHSQDLTSLCDLIFSITKIKVPVVLIYDIENMKLQSFLNFLDTKKSLGFLLESVNEFDTQFEYFINNIINNAISSKNIENDQITLDLLYLQNEKSTIQLNLEQVLNSSMFPRGVFFICFDKINLKNQLDFTEGLYSNILYSLASEAKVINTYENPKNAILKQVFIFFALIITGFLGIRYINNTQNRIKNIKISIHIANDVCKNQYNDEIQILNHIKEINTNNITFLSQFLLKKEMYNIQFIRNFLISSSARIFEDIGNIESEDFFDYSPVTTKVFQTLEFNVESLVSAIEEISRFMNNENTYHSLENKLNHYYETTRSKILSNFQGFLKYFDNYILIRETQGLQESMQDLFQSPSAENMNILIERSNNIKQYFKLSSNSWWIKEQLGENYENLLSKIKKTPKIGDTLHSKIIYITENAIKKVKDSIISADSTYVGNIFIIENDTLRFSKKMEDFLYHCKNLLNEDMLYFKAKEFFYSVPEKSEISLWDLDILDKIQQKILYREEFIKNIASYSSEIKRIAMIIFDNNLMLYIKQNLCFAQKLLTNSISIEEKSKSLGDAIKKIDKITAFMKKSLNKPIPSFVDFLIADSISKITAEFHEILNNSNFTAYTNLNKWNGENLVKFLFNCSNEDLPFIINKNINYLQELKTTVISNIMNKISEISETEYKFIKYIFQEIDRYTSGQKNYISIIETNINELVNWEIKYRNPDINYSSKEDFFSYHTKAFKKHLILNTNRVVLNRSKQYYNEIVTFFNNRISGRFPFGSNIAVSTIDLIAFLKLYNQYRNHLINDYDFMKLQLPITIKNLDTLNNFFVIENDILYIKAKIQYHLPEGKNNYLIKNYFSKFGDQVLHSDLIDIQYKANLGFILGIEIVKSSHFKMIFKNSNNQQLLVTKKKFTHLEDFGFLAFTKKYIDRIQDQDIILKIPIPIKSEKNEEIEEIICFIKVLNYPYFFDKMTEIK